MMRGSLYFDLLVFGVLVALAGGRDDEREGGTEVARDDGGARAPRSCALWKVLRSEEGVGRGSERGVRGVLWEEAVSSSRTLERVLEEEVRDVGARCGVGGSRGSALSRSARRGVAGGV